MSRMKTFLIYFVLLVGFLLLSIFLENLAIEKTFRNITNTGVVGQTGEVSIIIDEVRASNVNGYFKFKVKNNTKEIVKNSYIKVEMKNRQNQIAVTDYVSIENLKGSEERNVTLKFKANNIVSYQMRMVEDMPARNPWYIFEVFGIRVDLSNVFGLDLRNVFEWCKDGILWFLRLASGIPAWAYFVGAIIILIQMPSKFLFGIFPL